MLINGKICEDSRFDNLTADEKCYMCQYTRATCGNFMYYKGFQRDNFIVFLLFVIITAIWIWLIYLGLTIGVGSTAEYIRNLFSL